MTLRRRYRRPPRSSGRRRQIPSAAAAALAGWVLGMGAPSCQKATREIAEGSGGVTSPSAPERKASAARDLEQLGREVGLTFPPGTRVLGVSRERGIDDLVEIAVEMNQSDLAVFLDRAPVKREDFRPGERGLLGPDHDWWTPHQATNLRSGQALLPKGRTLDIGIAERSPGKVTVYVVNHGT